MKKTIPDFENYSISLSGEIKNEKFNRVLRQQKNTSGYLKVWLYKNKKRCEKFVHKLMLESFKENPNQLYNQGNHINGIKTDNRIENLEWCDNSGNQRHAYKIGLNVGRGKRIDAIQAETIRQCYKSGITAIQIARYFKMSPQNVYSYV